MSLTRKESNEEILQLLPQANITASPTLFQRKKERIIPSYLWFMFSIYYIICGGIFTYSSIQPCQKGNINKDCLTGNSLAGLFYLFAAIFIVKGISNNIENHKPRPNL